MPTILGANTLSDDFEITNSLRFDNDSSTQLLFTPSSASNRRTYTVSFWIKRGSVGEQVNMFGTASEGDNVYFESGGKLGFFQEGSSQSYLITNRLFTDPTAWFNIVIAVDTTQGTAADRVKLYINGTQYTWDSSTTYPSQNYQGDINNNQEQKIGNGHHGAIFDGHLAEFNLIDGTALGPTSFGKANDNNVWVPIDTASLTFGTNGYRLEFKQTGTSQNSSGIGADTSGNDNHWAVSNIAADHVSTDTPSNNFCTLNPLTKRPAANGTITEANLEYEASTNDSSIYGTLAIPAGMKVYFEVKLVSNTAQNALGIHNLYDGGDGEFVKGGSEAGTYSLKVRGSANTTQYFNNGSTNNTSTNNYANDTIIGVAVDNSNGQIHYHVDGTYINNSDPTDNNPVALVTGFGGSNEQYLHFSLDTSGGTDPKNQFNFGNPVHSISSSQADDAGYGNFEHDVPAGYYSLCTKNIAEYG